MVCYRFAISTLLKVKGLPALFLISLCLLVSLPAADRLFAQGAPTKLEINYQNRLLSVTAENVDIKDFFSRLAEKAHITIAYPATLDKRITLNRENVSLKSFLSSFLRNMNHVIIYSGSDAKNSRISEVHIYPKSTVSRLPRSSGASVSNRSQDRIRRRIDSYKKIVEKLRETLSGVGEDSSRAQVYRNRIQRYEERIKNLENQQ